MKQLSITLVVLTGMMILLFILGFYYNYQISPVSRKSEEVIVEIPSGSVYSIGDILYDNSLIRNKFIFKLYVKLNRIDDLKASTYALNKNMSLKEIIQVLEDGNGYNPDEIMITFKEGLNIRKIAQVIADETDNSYDDVMDLMNNTEYIQELINKYWFLTDDILNEKIYYPLEGYLFPDTYAFSSKSVSVKEIIEKMLDEMGNKLEKYREKIDNSNLSIHQILTLASIVELEGTNASDRAKVAGVFYNRLQDGWNIGSDVTTYYYLKIDDFTESLNGNENLYTCDYAYNTRCTSFIGLPVGPIANPGEESIDGTINKEDHNYYYFVADCTGKTYFSKNATEHYNTISRLKEENNWCS